MKPIIGRQSREVPLLCEFASLWVEGNRPVWKASYVKTVLNTLSLWIVPGLGFWRVDNIDRAALIEFRAQVARHERRPSAARINKIMSILRALLVEAGRQFDFDPHGGTLRKLRERRRDVQPFSPLEVQQIVEAAGPVWGDYYLVRFLTGLRTAEIDGLKWSYIDFESRKILVRETIVEGIVDSTKTESSERDVDMVPAVVAALLRQRERTRSRSEFAFCSRAGTPLRHGNVRKRIWLPLLKTLGLAPRRQYETRHTYATLMLAAGENPEYIRRQMGHRDTTMLFTVYSRFVPNVTRRDGSAFEVVASTIA